MTSLEIPWDDLHHRSYFLLELITIGSGEFTLTMTGDRFCPINPLSMHAIYAKGNMETIPKMIPIDISRTLSIMENVFIGAYCTPKIFEPTKTYFKNYVTCLPGLTRKCWA
jgi:hypothetical protein